ncbi:MAG: AI-2E family transporter [Oscillospiraceae bacterium]
MDLNSKNIKKILLIISFAILLFLGLQNFGLVCDYLVAGYRLLSPFIIGLCLAFILNVLLKLLEEKVFARLNRKNSKIWNRCRRGVCLSLTVLIVLGLMFVLVFMIVPELQKSFGMLIDNIPYYTQSVQKWTDSLLASLNISQEIFEDIRVDWDKLLGMLGDFLKNFSGNFVSKTVDITTSIFSGIVNFVLGVVFSIYMLMHKEKLCGQAKRIAFAFYRRSTPTTSTLGGKTLQQDVFPFCRRTANRGGHHRYALFPGHEYL